jgi:hypothetical protein
MMTNTYQVYVNLHFDPSSNTLPNDKWELIKVVGQNPKFGKAEISAIGFALERRSRETCKFPACVYTSTTDPRSPGTVLKCFSVRVPTRH